MATMATMATAHTHPFGVLLKRLRRAHGISQELLAERAHYSAGYIGMLERGVRSPLPATAELLADALDLGPEERVLLTVAARSRTPALPTEVPLSGALSPLVGRHGELALLVDHLGRPGRPVCVLCGEPGIGKTRLLREMAARASASGWRVLVGSCQRRGYEPFAPLLSALEGYIAHRPDAELRAALDGCVWLSRLLPEVAELVPVSASASSSLPPGQERRLIFRAVRRFLANVAGPSGTLLLLDDLQWAGADAVDLLDSLVRAPVATPLRVIGAYRDSELEAGHPLAGLLADLTRDGQAARLKLGELAAEDAEALLVSLLPGAMVGSSEVLRVLGQTRGVPFYVVSYALAMKADGEEDERARNVPWDVAQSIRQRVAAVPRAGQELLDIASVVGRSAPRGLLLSVAQSLGWSERELWEMADLVCRARLLMEETGDSYTFAHDLIREVVIVDQGAARRAALHRRVAEALEREPGAHAAELADHYMRAGVTAKAVEYLQRAGNEALALHAYAEAAAFYRALLERLDSAGDDVRAAAVCESLGEALSRGSRYAEALEALERAWMMYRRCDDVEGCGSVLGRMGGVDALWGRPREGLDTVQARMEPLVATGLSAHGQADLYLTLAELFRIPGRHEDRQAAAERAMEHARAAGEPRLLAEAAHQRGLALLAVGRAGEAAAALEGAVETAETSGDAWVLTQTLTARAMTARIAGELRQAHGYFERALEAAMQTGVPTLIGYVLFLLGELVYLRGEWQQARERFEQAAETLREVEASWVLPYPALGLGLLSLGEGKREDVERYLEREVLPETARTENLYVLRWALPNIAEQDLLDGHPEVARDRMEPWLDRPGEREDADVTAMLPFLAWAYLDLGEQARAETVIAEAVRRATEGQHTNALVDALRVRGIVATRTGRYDEAEEAFEQAIALGERMSYPHTVAKARYAYGLLHLRRGEREPAEAHLRQALAICERLGERLFAEHIERALATAASMAAVAQAAGAGSAAKRRSGGKRRR